MIWITLTGTKIGNKILFFGTMIVNPNTGHIVAPPTVHHLHTDESLLLEGELNFRLVLLSGGRYQLCTHRGECLEGNEATLMLIPQGEVCRLRALSEKVQVLSISFRADPKLCNMDCPKRHRDKKRVAKCYTEQEQETLYKSRPRRSKPDITQLSSHRSIELWSESIVCLLGLGSVEARHFDIKLEELFALLRLSYPREAVEAFLKHYHCRIGGFRGAVCSAYRKDMEVSNLYTLGEQMGLSEMAFKRSFYEEFGLSPRSWLVEQRAKAVYRELVATDKPLKELSHEFGFCSVSHFGVFCKQTLGDTPMHIRKGKKLSQ